MTLVSELILFQQLNMQFEMIDELICQNVLFNAYQYKISFIRNFYYRSFRELLVIGVLIYTSFYVVITRTYVSYLTQGIFMFI